MVATTSIPNNTALLLALLVPFSQQKCSEYAAVHESGVFLSANLYFYVNISMQLTAYATTPLQGFETLPQHGHP